MRFNLPTIFYTEPVSSVTIVAFFFIAYAFTWILHGLIIILHLPFKRTLRSPARVLYFLGLGGSLIAALLLTHLIDRFWLIVSLFMVTLSLYSSDSFFYYFTSFFHRSISIINSRIFFGISGLLLTLFGIHNLGLLRKIGSISDASTSLTERVNAARLTTMTRFSAYNYVIGSFLFGLVVSIALGPCTLSLVHQPYH